MITMQPRYFRLAAIALALTIAIATVAFASPVAPNNSRPARIRLKLSSGIILGRPHGATLVGRWMHRIGSPDLGSVSFPPTPVADVLQRAVEPHVAPSGSHTDDELTNLEEHASPSRFPGA